MNTISIWNTRSARIVLAVFAVTSLCAIPSRVGLAAQPTATKGHLLFNPLPEIKSRTEAFAAGIHQLEGQFDAAPKLLGAVNSQDENVMIVEFRAAQHGNPVSGLAITTYDPAGNSHTAALYDSPDHFAKSLPVLLKQFQHDTEANLKKNRPAPTGPDFAAFEAAADHVQLTETDFPDGTASIGIAQGFTANTMSGGRFAVSAADGAYANLYVPISILDPRGTVYQREIGMTGGRPPMIPGQTVIAYDPDPLVDWKHVLVTRANERGDADPDPQVLSDEPLKTGTGGFTGKMVAGTMTLHKEPYVFSGILLITPPPQADGGWLLQVTMRVAPAAHAAEDMPALIAMQRSEKVDMNAVIDQTMRNIDAINVESSRWMAAMQAAGDAERNRVYATSMHNAQVARADMDIANDAFLHYVNSEAPTATSMLAALAKSAPQGFHVVPVRQYAPGPDD